VEIPPEGGGTTEQTALNPTGDVSAATIGEHKKKKKKILIIWSDPPCVFFIPIICGLLWPYFEILILPRNNHANRNLHFARKKKNLGIVRENLSTTCDFMESKSSKAQWEKWPGKFGWGGGGGGRTPNEFQGS
jgi:hypothetical protein